MVAGMIEADMHSAISVAQDALLSALRAPDRTTLVHHLSRIGHALDAMEDTKDRVRTLEATPVPAHWRPQWLDYADLPPNVVPLRKPQAQRLHGGAA
jgi:hypothetical protein